MSKKKSSSMKSSNRKSNNRARKQRNNLFLFAAVAVIVVIVVVVLISNGKGEQKVSANDKFPMEITVEQAYQKYEEGITLLDVRELDEWNSFHIPNTTFIPLGELENRLDELPKDRPIIVVCRSGNRSQAGRDILLGAGFENVSSMAGGVTQWSNLGYPIEGTRP